MKKGVQEIHRKFVLAPAGNRRMMHEKDERPPNEKSHAYQFSFTYNGCGFCLLTPPAILALPKCIFKEGRL